MSEKENPSNIHQTVPLLPRILDGINGLDCLRRVDSLYVKQYVSLTEGKLVWKKDEIYIYDYWSNM